MATYDGSFGTGDLSTEGTIRELTGIVGDLATSKAAIDDLMNPPLDFPWESANFAFTGGDIDLITHSIWNFESANFPYTATDPAWTINVIPFGWESTNFSFVGTPMEMRYVGTFAWEFTNFGFTEGDFELVPGPYIIRFPSTNFPFRGSEAYIQQTESVYSLLALDYLWYEGDYPPFEYVPGSLQIERYMPHWDGTPDLDSWKNIPVALTGEVIRNDHVPTDNWVNDGMLASAPLLYFFGCDVEPKEIVVPGVITEDYFVPITISNNHLDKSILVNNIFIVDDPFGTMSITPQNWPRYIPPYSFVTYTLKISATEGYPKFEATLVVDAGTCYTEIPITGVRNVDCPECPECPPPCPPEETEDMPSCMIEQELCAISRGDTVPFNFVFTTPTGAAMDISNMQLEFTLKLDVKQEIPDLINTVTFPATPDSIGGIGTMKITPAETLQLLAGAKYCFKFKLKNGVNDVYTVGLGWVSVNPDPPTAISE